MIDEYTLEAKKNHTTSWRLQFFQPLVNTSPVDFTGVTTISFRARYAWNSSTSELTCDISDGITIENAVQGLLLLTISAAKTSPLPNTEIPLVYDLRYETTGGSPQPVLLLSGTLKIYPSVF